MFELWRLKQTLTKIVVLWQVMCSQDHGQKECTIQGLWKNGLVNVGGQRALFCCFSQRFWSWCLWHHSGVWVRLFLPFMALIRNKLDSDLFQSTNWNRWTKFNLLIFYLYKSNKLKSSKLHSMVFVNVWNCSLRTWFIVAEILFYLVKNENHKPY